MHRQYKGLLEVEEGMVLVEEQMYMFHRMYIGCRNYHGQGGASRFIHQWRQVLYCLLFFCEFLLRLIICATNVVDFIASMEEFIRQGSLDELRAKHGPFEAIKRERLPLPVVPDILHGNHTEGHEDFRISDQSMISEIKKVSLHMLYSFASSAFTHPDHCVHRGSDVPLGRSEYILPDDHVHQRRRAGDDVRVSCSMVDPRPSSRISDADVE